jgi:hypothetical protein
VNRAKNDGPELIDEALSPHRPLVQPNAQVGSALVLVRTIIPLVPLIDRLERVEEIHEVGVILRTQPDIEPTVIKINHRVEVGRRAIVEIRGPAARAHAASGP